MKPWQAVEILTGHKQWETSVSFIHLFIFYILRRIVELKVVDLITPGTPLPAVGSGAPVRSIEKTTGSLRLPY